MRELADIEHKIIGTTTVCERTDGYRTNDHEHEIMNNNSVTVRELADVEHKIMNNNSVTV